MTPEELKAAGFTDKEIAEYKPMPTFDITGDEAKAMFDKAQGLANAGFSEREIAEYFSKQQTPKKEIPKSDWKRTAMDMTRTTLEGVGMLGGAAVGGGAGTLTAPLTGPFGPTAGAIAGGGLGYAGGKKVADIVEEVFGMKKPAPLGEQIVQTGKDVGSGAFMTATGEAGGLALSKFVPPVGTFAKDMWGRLTGKGKEAIAAAYRNSPDFRLANQGKLTGEQIVENSKEVLQGIVEKRGAEYAVKLQEVQANPALLDQVKTQAQSKLNQLVSNNEFSIGVSQTPQGELIVDFTNSPLVKNQGVIEKAIKDVSTWADTSAAGLDVLKKRLGTYMGQVERGSPSSTFLSKLYNEVKTGLEGAVPEYANMTKSYAEATQLIKDLESGLMLKKSGLSGRVTADNTLRRLMSALKDNFEMRGDLLKTLSNQGGENVLDQVAGYAMKDWLPAGLMGSGPGLIGQGFMMLNPKLWPIVAASSPKVSTQFLQIYGKFAKELYGSQTLYSQALSFAGKKVKERQE